MVKIIILKNTFQQPKQTDKPEFNAKEVNLRTFRLAPRTGKGSSNNAGEHQRAARDS